MKYIFILSLFALSTEINAQDYPAFKFKTIKTQWDYFSSDKNFVKDNKNDNITKYTSVFGSDFLNSNGKLFILQNTLSPNPFIMENGYLIHKIDSKSGNIDWIKYNNTNNIDYKLNKYGQVLVSNRSFINERNQLVVLTRVSKDTFKMGGFNPLFFHFNYAENVFDLKDGSEISTTIGTSNIKTGIDCSNCLNNIFVRRMNDYCHLSYNFDVEKNLTYEKADFYPLKPDMNIDTTSLRSIKYQTSIFATFPIGDFPDIFQQLNKDTLMILNYVVNLIDQENSPDKATLRWINISNSDYIKEVHEMDIKPYYELPDRNFYKEQPTVKTLDNNIILSQRIFADKTKPFKGTYWILWLDAKGNTRASIRSLKVDSKIFDDVHPYKVIGDYLYLTGEYEDGEERGIDLIEIHQGTNEIRIACNLINYPHFRNSRRISAIGSLWMDDEYSAFGFRLLKDTTNLTSNYNYYICVRNENLGIVSSSKEVLQLLDCTIYPNPTMDQIEIAFGKAYTGTLLVLDIYARPVIQPITLKETNHYDFSLLNLPSGTYFIQLNDGSGGIQFVGRPLIKL